MLQLWENRGVIISQAIRAIYQNGQIRLLEPVDLVEGQEIQLMILSDREQVRAALADLLVTGDTDIDEMADEAKLLEEISDAFDGLQPLSQTIIDERHEGR